MDSKLKFKVFQSSYESWDSLSNQACEFASLVGRENVVNISHSCCGSNDGVITVWYWEDEMSGQMFEINQVNFGD